jgi:hypothetical protein
MPRVQGANSVNAQGQGNGHGRDTQDNPNASWALYKRIWDKVMAVDGFIYDNIGFEDIQGDNAMTLLDLFQKKARATPPLKENGVEPYASDVIVGAFDGVITKLKVKFRNQMGRQANENSFFPPTNIAAIRTKLRKGRSLNLMEDDADVFKAVFPLNREDSGVRTVLYSHLGLTPDAVAGRETTQRNSLLKVCSDKFRKNKFLQNVYIIGTNNAVGRGGEIKFMTYRSSFLDESIGGWYIQRFQRKTLKTNPAVIIWQQNQISLR